MWAWVFTGAPVRQCWHPKRGTHTRGCGIGFANEAMGMWPSQPWNQGLLVHLAAFQPWTQALPAPSASDVPASYLAIRKSTGLLEKAKPVEWDLWELSYVTLSKTSVSFILKCTVVRIKKINHKKCPMTIQLNGLHHTIPKNTWFTSNLTNIQGVMLGSFPVPLLIC